MVDQGGGFGEMSYAFWQAHYATQRLTDREVNRLDPRIPSRPALSQAQNSTGNHLFGVISDIYQNTNWSYKSERLKIWSRYDFSTAGVTEFSVYSETSITIDHDSPLTVSNTSIKIGNVEIDPDSISANFPNNLNISSIFNIADPATYSGSVNVPMKYGDAAIDQTLIGEVRYSPNPTAIRDTAIVSFVVFGTAGFLIIGPAVLPAMSLSLCELGGVC